MRYIVRGVIIITGIVLVFVLLTACAPNKALTKERLFGSKNPAAAAEDEYVYEYNEEGENGYSQNGKRQVRRSAGEVERPAVREDEPYTPEETSLRKEKFLQTGIASWYGREFHGEITASGDKFNMKDFTAAHRSLPFGSVVIVKNLDNGKVARVRINDRGPYKKDRILDLSHAAAKKLDMLEDGEAMVGISLAGTGKKLSGNTDEGRELEPVSGMGVGKYDEESVSDRFSEDGVGGGTYAVQAGAFYSQKNAQNLKNKLQESMSNPIIVVREGDLYKVRIEGIRSRKDAERQVKQLQKDEIPSFLLRDGE